MLPREVFEHIQKYNKERAFQLASAFVMSITVCSNEYSLEQKKQLLEDAEEAFMKAIQAGSIDWHIQCLNQNGTFIHEPEDFHNTNVIIKRKREN